MRRGRPRHDDVLTPREWEVLDLLREGQTNEQIAARLGIAPDTAKFHVSEILGKLGVESRQQAAAWQGRPRAAPALAPVLALFGRPLAPKLGLVALAAVCAALLFLTIGVASMRSRSGNQPTVDPTVVEYGENNVPLAPNGRTGNREVDSLIEELLTEDADSLARRFVDARVEEVRYLGPQEVGKSEYEQREVPLAEWTQRLAGSTSSLYAVYPDNETLTSVYLAVDVGDRPLEAWTVGVHTESASVAFIQIHNGYTDPRRTRTQRLQDAVPAPSYAFAAYLVFPPAEDLPTQPPGHDLSTSTGERNVDLILAGLREHDVEALKAMLPSVDEFQTLDCGRRGVTNRFWGERLLDRVALSVVSVNAVANVAPGYDPPADHVIVVVTKEAPYRWRVFGLIERDARILGAILYDCEPVAPDPGRYYPPGSYLLAPPAPGASADTSRRSGIAAVDRVLDALQSGDSARLAPLLEYEPVGCVPEDGVGMPPRCPAGVKRGTPIDAIGRGCEGGYFVPDAAPGQLTRWLRAGSLYAIVERSTSTGGRRLALTIALSELSYATLLLDREKITAIETSCPHARHPSTGVRGEPDFLLPPP